MMVEIYVMPCKAVLLCITCMQRFEIICCFYLQGRMDTEYDFKTKRPKSIRPPQHFLPDCWLVVSIRKVLIPATSAQTFLGFPVSISKC